MHGSETFFLDADLYEGLAGFRYALRRFLKFSEAATRAAGITSQQYQALLVIKADPAGAIMIKDLADQLPTQHHSTVELIDRLVNADFVERRHSPTDGRTVLVAMTEAGVKLLERLVSSHVKELLEEEPLWRKRLGSSDA